MKLAASIREITLEKPTRVSLHCAIDDRSVLNVCRRAVCCIYLHQVFGGLSKFIGYRFFLLVNYFNIEFLGYLYDMKDF